MIRKATDITNWQLAIAMLQGKMQFPAMIILDEQENFITRIQLFRTPELFELLLYYYGEDYYKKASWEDFLKTFKAKVKPWKPVENKTDTK